MKKKSIVFDDLTEHQKDVVYAILEEFKTSNIVTLAGSAGCGKAQPLDEPVLTPDGFKPMRLIESGSLVVNEEGKPIKVLDVFKHENLKMYEVKFSDGSSTRCCEDHLWEIQTKKLATNNRFKVVDTKSLMIDCSFRKSTKSGFKYRIPCIKPIEFIEQSYEISPYSMGYILGNGSSNGYQLITTIGSLDYKEILSFFNPKEILSTKVKNDSISLIAVSKECRKYYDSLGLNHIKSIHKWIPPEYLHGSIQQRKDLLAGLLDSDGTCAKNRCSFSSSSKKLLDDVSWLVRSLGGRAKSHTSLRKGNPEYRLTIRLPFNPFRLKRKAEQYTIVKSDYNLVRFISEINYIGEYAGQCILVDSPRHLYVTKDFIVTHNTFVLHGLIQKLVTETNCNITMTAPTHKAVSLLENNFSEVVTIHKALGLVLVREFGSQKLQPKGKVSTGEYLFLDESSMVDTELLNFVKDAIRRGHFKKVLLCGDSYQLPPVEQVGKKVDYKAKAVIPAFTDIPVYELTEIIRQKKGSNIITLAEEIKKCFEVKSFFLSKKLQTDLGFPIMSLENCIDAYVDELRKDLSFAVNNRIVSYTNDRVDYINNVIRKKLFGNDVKEYKVGETIIIQQPVVKDVPNRDYKEIIINNGEELIITESKAGYYTYTDDNISKVISTYKVRVKYYDVVLTFVAEDSINTYNEIKKHLYTKRGAKKADWKRYWAFVDLFNSSKYSYASTIHKSQGSTYHACLFDLYKLPDYIPDLFNRLFYVATTRASLDLFFME